MGLCAGQMNGVELNYMACRDLDERLDYYTPVIITSDEVIESDPDMIKAFLRATKKGYEDAWQIPTRRRSFWPPT